MKKGKNSSLLLKCCTVALPEVGWSLTSLSSTNIRDERSGMESYLYPVKEGWRYINLNPGHLFVQQPPKKGKGIERLI